MDDTVRDYIDAMSPDSRALFDRLHRLILEAHPDAAVALAYTSPPTGSAGAGFRWRVEARDLDLRLGAGPLSIATIPPGEISGRGP